MIIWTKNHCFKTIGNSCAITMTFSHTVSPHSRFGIILHSHLSLDTQRIPKSSHHFLCDAQNLSAWSEGKYVSLFRITADVLETILTSLQQQGSPGPS